MSAAEKCIVGCWIAFAFYWFISAFSRKRTAERQSWTGILAHRLPTYLGVFLLVWHRPPHPLNLQIVPDPALAEVLGAVICVFGLSGAIWARTTLGRNWSSEVMFKQEHELIERGPYRFVRHPIYTSVLTMCFGSALASARLSSCLGLPLLVLGFWIKLRLEEALLTRHFPAEYSAYAKRVKALIPFVL